jgi:hypothetical protein
MKNAWKEKEITAFATNRTDVQRLFNILLGLMGGPDAQRGAVQYSERCRLEMGIFKCASLRLRVS